MEHLVKRNSNFLTDPMKKKIVEVGKKGRYTQSRIGSPYFALDGSQKPIKLTEGDVQDYDYIRHTINELALKYRIKSIAFDRWNSTQLVNNLQDDGATMSPFGQGYASMSAPTSSSVPRRRSSG